MKMPLQSALLYLCTVVLAACATQPGVEVPLDVPEIRPGILVGYLAPGTMPDSDALLPPPPAAGSEAEARDQAISQALLGLDGSPRFELAARDADLHFPGAAETFACAVGAPISEAGTPNLYVLLRRTMADAGLATYPAKNHYQRQRPFVVNGAPSCTPKEESMLANDGSYPSGHSALGWAWALILAELAPDRADAVLARGMAFTESRMVCNVHWASDVEAGRLVGSAAVARLHADPVFSAQLALARAELERARAVSADLPRDCATESAVLKLALPR